jgi:hypothetical protein
MMCRSTLLHRGHPNVRKSLPNELGSIAVNLIGELQLVHCGPWFCTSSMASPRGRRERYRALGHRYLPLWCGDVSNMLPGVAGVLVNIAQFAKLN